MWDDRFENTLRAYLPFLSADEQLEAGTQLRDLGLDSMGTVQLLAEIEADYGVRFVDDALTPETFATPTSLWTALSQMAPV